MSIAQRNYEKGEYQEALNELTEIEKLDKKTNSGILYLKILAQRALLPGENNPDFYDQPEKFDLLEQLREHCIVYLSYPAVSKIPVVRLQKIRSVQQSLKNYPIAKVQFDENRHLHRSVKEQKN